MTGLYFIALGLLLAAAFFVQARWPAPAAEPIIRTPGAPWNERRSDQLLWLGFILVSLACFAIQVYLTRKTFIDDAYIVFRYSQNLLEGYGLRWNAQDAPTEGFTDLLYVVLVAPFMALGVDPLFAARALNALALGGIVYLLYRILRRDFPLSRLAAGAIATGFIVATRSAEILTGGLETIVFTFFFFWSFERALAFYREPTRNNAFTVGVLSFLAFLVRPEGVFVPIAVIASFVLLDQWRSAEQRKGLIVLLASFGAPLALYLVWKQLYFGSIVPNPALIKAAQHFLTSERGLRSIGNFFGDHPVLLVTAAASLLPLRARPVGRPELTAILLVVGYLLFYARVDTLADWAERYFFPVTTVLFFLAMPVFVLALRTLCTWTAIAPAKLAVGLFLMCALFFRVQNGIEGYGWLLKVGAVSGPEDRNLVLGHRLAKIDGIRDMSIASVDAGAVPFATQSYHIDMVGLNTRYIAEHLDTKSAAAYLFEKQPTIILYRTLQSGDYVTTGHGPLGDERTWAANPGWDDYAYAGTFDESGIYCMNIFIRRDAPRFDDLMTTVETTVVDRVSSAPPVKLGRLAAN